MELAWHTILPSIFDVPLCGVTEGRGLIHHSFIAPNISGIAVFRGSHCLARELQVWWARWSHWTEAGAYRTRRSYAGSVVIAEQ
ncbi:hypothetical protein BCON_0071g00470 [Botryotinia convoluta]|uniref:Uncharacterized protein n=1 Tax=Botryotinia convoluta TaxID=54673 RepID=A0A4Z1IBS9_9HELO|nr:hypothetical protein BCON_0071g00470 [Botryotinia convoluta]